MPADRSSQQAGTAAPFDLNALQHVLAIKSIADELGLPLAEVAQMYRSQFEQLARRASVTDFLPVLVARKIREQLRRERTGPAR